MKKNSKKGSILLWAVMLSLIIAITFISISTKINKNIKLSWDFAKFNDENKNIEELMEKWENKNISSNKTIIFDNDKEKIFSLKKEETKEFSFSGSDNFSIEIWIIEWWALNYNYTFDSIITSSWIINFSKTFTWELDNTSKTWSLIFKNFW